eukprot:scaffold117098_cov18-Tisochrysis_lutea.AAC.1
MSLHRVRKSSGKLAWRAIRAWSGKGCEFCIFQGESPRHPADRHQVSVRMPQPVSGPPQNTAHKRIPWNETPIPPGLVQGGAHFLRPLLFCCDSGVQAHLPHGIQVSRHLHETGHKGE